MKHYHDNFAHDFLPKQALQPSYFKGKYEDEMLNCVDQLLDIHIREGRGNNICIQTFQESWTYQDLLRKYVIAENILSKRIEGYQPLDLKKNIIDPNTPKKRQGVAQFQELDKENRELHQALGDQRHPLDMDPAELARRQQRNQGRLSRQSARQLDQRRR